MSVSLYTIFGDNVDCKNCVLHKISFANFVCSSLKDYVTNKKKETSNLIFCVDSIAQIVKTKSMALEPMI